MRKIIILTIILFGFIQNSQAQSNLWTVNWDISSAIGSTGDFIDKTGFGGFSIDGRHFIENNISIGGSFSWHVFHEIYGNLPPIEIEVVDGVGGHISGTQYRYANVLPLLVIGHLYVDTGESIKPYVGLGVGTVYMEERVEIGFVALQDNSWGLGIQPSIGAFIPFGVSSSGVNLAIKYTYGTNSGNIIDSVSLLTFSIGFGFLD